MKTHIPWTIAAIWLAVQTALAAPQLRHEQGGYRLTGAPLECTWDAATGAVRSLREAVTGEVLVTNADKSFALHTKAGWVDCETGLRLQQVVLQPAAGADAPAVVRLEYSGGGWTAEETWRFDRRVPFVARTVVLTAGGKAGAATFDESRLVLGNLGDGLNKSRLYAPFTWPPVASGVTEFARRDGNVALSCATAIPGTVVAPLRGGRAVAFGQYWLKDWNIWLARGRQGAVRLETKYLCQGRAHPGLRIPFGGQFVSVVPGGVRAGMKALGEAWVRLGFRRPPWPQWVNDRGLSLYSLSAKGTMGSWARDLLDEQGRHGLRNFQRLQLPLVRRLGVTAIWFLPVWPRGYGVSDYWSLDPAAGSVSDLREVVAQAHRDDVRVLCDLIPHGPHESSGLATEHPEFLVRDPAGKKVYWWGCLACDYAHPGWQEYMARVARHWVKTCDLDGYRVDVAGGGRINWKPYDDYLPSWSQQWGGLGVMRRVRETLDRTKPGCLLLGECANPPMLGEAQCVYDWFLERVFYEFLETEPAAWVRQLRTVLEHEYLALPSGAAAGMMHFTENHDQVHSAWKLGPGAARAIWALCALAHGFPLIYHGQEVGFEDLWANLLTLRSELPELSSGGAEYEQVTCSAPRVLTFARLNDSGASLAAINFSPTRRRAIIRWPNAPHELTWLRRFPDNSVERVRRGAAGVEVMCELAPWGWQVLALRESREAAAGIPALSPLRPVPVNPKPSGPTLPTVRVTLRTRLGRERTMILGGRDGDRVDDKAGAARGVQITEGALALDWQNGLVASLRSGQATLLAGTGIFEGKERMFSGPDLFRVWAGQRENVDPDPQARWSVERLHNGEVELRWRQDIGGATFSSLWTVRPGGSIDCDLQVAPRVSTGPALGRLTAVFAGPRAKPGAPPMTRWRVATVEGEMGGPFAVRHPTPRELTGRYWHPVQRLWEQSLLPLALDRPVIDWETQGRRLSVSPLSQQPTFGTVVNAWLYEYRPDGTPGLTLFVAGADARNPVEFGPRHPFHVRLRLSIDGEKPAARPVHTPVKFRTEGANWYVSNNWYRVRLRRSAGGNLRFLGLAAGGGPVVAASQTYTDYGILGYRVDPVGKQYKVVGTNANDFEPDCRVLPSPEKLELQFFGRMRQRGQDRNLTSPPVEYHTTWTFEAGPFIGVRHTVQPLLTPRPRNKAFLAQTLTVPDLIRWRVEKADETEEGRPGSDPKNRVWEQHGVTAANVRILLENPEGMVEVTNVHAVNEPLQNLFIAHSGRRYVLFFAFLDGEPCTLDARLRGVEYRLRALPRKEGAS